MLVGLRFIIVLVLAVNVQAWQTQTISEHRHVTADLTIADDTVLRFQDGGVFDIAAGATLTINGAVDAPLQQIFTGPGRVVIGPGRVERVYAQWWGARGDGKHDDTAAIQAAIDAPTGGILFFPPGKYANTGVTARSRITLLGSGIGASSLVYTPKSGSCITLPKECAWLRIEKLSLASPGHTSGYGIDGTNEYVRYFSMRDFAIGGFKTGVYVAAGMHLSFNYGYVSCYGLGEANGSIGIKLGDKALDKACTTATITDIYFTNAETCFYNRAAPCIMIRPIFESCRIGLDSYTRGTVIGPFWAGCKTAAVRLTDNGLFFIGPFPAEKKILYENQIVQDRTSFFPDTFDSPMKLGLMELSPGGELKINGLQIHPPKQVKPQ